MRREYALVIKALHLGQKKRKDGEDEEKKQEKVKKVKREHPSPVNPLIVNPNV